RYYYNKRILHKTKGKRFTYKFNFNKLVMPNYPFINIRPNGVVPQSAPPVPTASSRFHFPPLDGHSPTEDPQPARFSGPPLVPSNPDVLGEGGERKPEVPELEDGSSDWRRGVDLMASRNAAGAGGAAPAPQKRKPDIVLPLFSRPSIYPDPHSPFAVSPLPGRGGGVLNVPISPALSLTPTLFSYSPSPGLSPFTGSSCFSFNPEEMKHYLHSQACSVFNYHLSPRTFPRYPLMVPPLQCQVPLEEQPQFPIKLQPPPAGRKNRERLESAEEPPARQLATPPPLHPPLRVKVEPAGDKEAEAEEPPKGKNEREENPGEEKGPVFARPAAPSWHPPPAAQPGFSSEESPEPGESSGEKNPREGAGETAAQEKREDALMPPKLRLKRRWNGDRQAEGPDEPPNGRLHWNGVLGGPHHPPAPKGVPAAAGSDT
ncbi:ETV3 protein, partial [Halcyon senegalensis]|nr:ETV3 protein [Halcyon senegalensis]